MKKQPETLTKEQIRSRAYYAKNKDKLCRNTRAKLKENLKDPKFARIYHAKASLNFKTHLKNPENLKKHRKLTRKRSTAISILIHKHQEEFIKIMKGGKTK